MHITNTFVSMLWDERSSSYKLLFRRASRISLSIPMNQLERRRSSVASTTSLSSTLVTSSKVGRNISATRNPLSAVVESKQKDSREGEITRKLSRLSLPGSSGQNSRKASMAMVNWKWRIYAIKFLEQHSTMIFYCLIWVKLLLNFFIKCIIYYYLVNYFINYYFLYGALAHISLYIL